MDEQNIPIDISVRKLLDWLISRHICNRDWHDKVGFIALTITTKKTEKDPPFETIAKKSFLVLLPPRLSASEKRLARLWRTCPKTTL